MPSIFERLLPFIFLGILLVLAVVGIILFSYLLIFGAIVGIVLFAIAWVRGLFVRKKIKSQKNERHKIGRTFDQ